MRILFPLAAVAVLFGSTAYAANSIESCVPNLSASQRTEALDLTRQIEEAVRASLVAGGSVSPTALESAERAAIQARIEMSGAAPSVVFAALRNAQSQLLTSGEACRSPGVTPSSTCQATYLSLRDDLATALQAGGVCTAGGGGQGNAPLGGPPPTGGGASGGITHPSVTSPAS
jgi:hypothetical protein